MDLTAEVNRAGRMGDESTTPLVMESAGGARLTGEPVPVTAAIVGRFARDNRSGGAVRFNLSQRAGCEGARESLGSHAASLNKGW